MSEDESGEGSASSADEDPVDQDEDSQADLNASMQEMNVQQVSTDSNPGPLELKIFSKWTVKRKINLQAVEDERNVVEHRNQIKHRRKKQNQKMLMLF